jgi:DNA repair protein RecO (recombination protein O)
MLQRTVGVVLKTFPYGEADLIVTYLTPDFGLLKVFAKSPRKIRSKFGSSLEPLTYSKISFWGKEDTSLPRLTQSDIINSFHPVRATLNIFFKISEIIEITLQFVPERDSNKNIFSLLITTLHDMENIALSSSHKEKSKAALVNENLLLTHYKVKILKLAGFAPKLDACGKCGKFGYNFYLSQGTILCNECVKGIDSPMAISSAVLRLYSDLLTWDTKKVNRIKPLETVISELSEILNIHIKYVLSKPLKTMEFIQSL